MPDLDKHALYELDILQQVERSSQLSNRMVSTKLGVSIKLAHAILKRMVQKGLLHVKVIHTRRWDYFLTPKGIAEKARLTLEFFDFSMHFYREARRRSSRVCRDLAESGVAAVCFLGAGDLAEIVYLGVQEWGLELVAVFDASRTTFMGLPVQPLHTFAESAPAVPVLVCLYDASEPMRANYLPTRIGSAANLHWVFTHQGYRSSDNRESDAV